MTGPQPDGDLGEGIVDLLGALVPCVPCVTGQANGTEHQCTSRASFSPGLPCPCCGGES